LQVRQRGGLRAMLQQRHQQQQAAAATAAARRTAQQRRPDFDRVVAALQRLPTEVVATKDDLERESVHDLKQRLINMNVELPKGCMEKGDLVAKVLEAAGHGSDGESCVICAEEYAPGDVVRVLPCRHRMHLECIDRWLLKSIEHSAPKGCPLCNDERWLSA
jgi:E3 ubiquitin-protein ligase RNF38/44